MNDLSAKNTKQVFFSKRNWLLYVLPTSFVLWTLNECFNNSYGPSYSFVDMLNDFHPTKILTFLIVYYLIACSGELLRLIQSFIQLVSAVITLFQDLSEWIKNPWLTLDNHGISFKQDVQTYTASKNESIGWDAAMERLSIKVPPKHNSN